MFDSHCHPTDIADPVEVVRSAASVGVTSLLACGYNKESNFAVEQLRVAISGLPISIGIHPWYANQSCSLEELRELLLRLRPAAVGECGLDAKEDVTIPPLSVQYPVFEVQLELARQLNLPVTVHSRRAVSKVHGIARHFREVRGVMHAFSGSYEQASSFLDQGWLIGVAGAVTRVNASKTRDLVRRLPLAGIVVETDAPAIGLMDVPPSTVRPAHLPRIVREIATLKQITMDDVVCATNLNAARMFGHWALRPLS